MGEQTGLDKMFEFGRHQHSLFGNIKNVFTAFAVCLIWTIGMMCFLRLALNMEMKDIHNLVSANLTVPSSMQLSVFMSFFLACVFAPLWEEIAFRWCPLTIARSIEKEGNLTQSKIVTPIMIGFAIFFGFCHGNIINILLQGVSGLMLAWVMIKSGYKWAVLTHFMWNFMLMFGMPVLMNTIK